jgi:hypothetical protein
VESSWTVTTLSPSLCWLQSYRSSRHSVQDVVVAFVRRALTYPYLRRWDLARRVLRDVVLILQGGKRHILRCLLKVRGGPGHNGRNGSWSLQLQRSVIGAIIIRVFECHLPNFFAIITLDL